MEPDPDVTKLPDGDPDATRVPPGPDPGATLAGPDVASGGLAPGRLVFGRYTLAAEAGRGGMGVVWRARDEKLDRTVALKFLPEAVAVDTEALRDLRRETRRCLDLTHPNIVRVYDLVEDGPLVAIAMEFIEGKSLAVRKTAAPAGCLGADELAPFVRQLCAALDYAHTEAKVVHRDLKPANLLITRDSRLKVADFGIARSLSETHTRLTGKAGDGTSGTLQYMSPQQLAGEKPTATDDVYALGATLYELLAGKPPFFRGDAHSLMKQIAETAPPSPTKRRLELELNGPPIPRTWEQAILACLAKDPAQRPRTTGEVAARLGLGSPMASAAPPRKPHMPRLVGLVVAVALAVVAAVFGPWGATTHAPPKPVSNPTLVGSDGESQQVETTRQLVAKEVARQLAMDKGSPPQAAPTSNATLPTPANVPPQDQVQQLPIFMPLVNGAAPTAGSNFTIPALALGMVWVANGTFRMGSPASEVGRRASEAQHWVILTQGYWLGQTDVTQAQWTAMMGSNPSRFKFKGGKLPVETVSWDDAMAFCQKLTGQEQAAGRLPNGYTYTLPTEAQWEYACRAGTTGPYAGNLDAMAWYVSNSGGQTHPVGAKQPNAWGLYDMPGNVLNWCADWFGPYSAGGGALTDPTGPVSGLGHVNRGGCWDYPASGCRSADRDNGPGHPGNYVGFRLALGVAPLAAGRFPAPAATTTEMTPVQKPPLLATLSNGTRPTPGGNFTIPGLAVGMVWITPGTFLMGSPADEVGRRAGETQHQVTLTQGYWLGQTDVTQAQWAAVMDHHTSYFMGGTLPVDSLKWNEAVAFCEQVGARERAAGRLPAGYTYTLPTEAQWEYACRAGTTGDYAGNLDALAWYHDNSGGTTHPVGTKQPNGWGLFDMSGEVWQWCLDWYGPYPGGVKTDPVGPAAGPGHVYRGGDWTEIAAECRPANRHGDAPGFGFSRIGFRVALARRP